MFLNWISYVRIKDYFFLEFMIYEYRYEDLEGFFAISHIFGMLLIFDISIKNAILL